MITDETWERIKPLIPDPRHKSVSRRTGRPRTDDRAVLEGILRILQTPMGWNSLPHELGDVSGKTCWRRHREWRDAGAWERIYQASIGSDRP